MSFKITQSPAIILYFFFDNKVRCSNSKFSMVLQDQATPLWIASQMGHTSVVKELLSSGADVDAIREVKVNFHLFTSPFVSNETRLDCVGFLLFKILNPNVT